MIEFLVFKKPTFANNNKKENNRSKKKKKNLKNKKTTLKIKESYMETILHLFVILI